MSKHLILALLIFNIVMMGEKMKPNVLENEESTRMSITIFDMHARRCGGKIACNKVASNNTTKIHPLLLQESEVRVVGNLK
jgi:hypothetical protein